MRRILLVCLSLWSLAPVAQGQESTAVMRFPEVRDPERSNRSVPIKVHLPGSTSVAEAPFPVVIISHGAGGTWDANFAQAQHLAQHGYAVLAVEHVGSNFDRFKAAGGVVDALKSMTRNATEVMNRPQDIGFAIDQLLEWNRSHPTLQGQLDPERIGVMGHSFGAYTALVSCGARPALDWLVPAQGRGLGPDLSDPRVKACVALSPQGPGEPFFLEESYASVNRPVLGITGSRDVQQFQLSPTHRRRFLDLMPAGETYFLWLTNADHSAFSDPSGSGRRGLPSRSRTDAQPVVKEATLQFFNVFVRGDESARAYLTANHLETFLQGKITELEWTHKEAPAP
ncbi:MAG: hypothetical protein OHK0012_12310 [Synechococcales cyanobacterium]